MQIVRLAREALPEARDLLATALAFDHVSAVAEEKLFGDDGARKGADLIAVDGDALADLKRLESVGFVMKGGIVYKGP